MLRCVSGLQVMSSLVDISTEVFALLDQFCPVEYVWNYYKLVSTEVQMGHDLCGITRICVPSTVLLGWEVQCGMILDPSLSHSLSLLRLQTASCSVDRKRGLGWGEEVV